MLQLKPEHYTVAWIAPLEIEAQAALHMLDERHRGKFPVSRGDDYVFHAGNICGHDVVIATLPAGQEYGAGSAAALASQVKKFFPNLWFGLLVGVAAGLPDLSRVPPRDIRLGDVLVGLPDGESAGLIAYDLGKETQDGFHPMRVGHALAMTEPIVRSAIGSIKLDAPNDAQIFLPHYNAICNKEHANGTFGDPGQDRDRLYLLKDDGTDEFIERSRRPESGRTRVWYGSIGSGEKLVEIAQRRDELRNKYGLIGLEMEAAGTMNRIPVGVIRGVCDYGDKHKNKEWQPYAAAMAAAYAKAVLNEIPRVEKKEHVSPTEPTRSIYSNSLTGRNIRSSMAYSDSVQSASDLSVQKPLTYRAIHFPINDDFIPRSAISKQIEKLIPPKIEYQSAALWGLGGSGKTQIALDYAYSRCSDPTCSVFWIHADTEGSFAQDYKWIARKLGITDNFDEKELLVAVRARVEILPQWVFILDNADDLTLFGVGHATNAESTPNLSEYIPRGPVGTVLWTSRDQRIAGTLVGSRRGINVARMTNEEAKILLDTSEVFDDNETEDKSDNVARLSAELDGLALAISQAAAFLRRTRMSITAYLEMIRVRKSRWEVLKRSEYDRHRRPQASNSVLETWNISMEYLQQENKTAHDILTVLAYVDSQNIPFEMIVKIAQANANNNCIMSGTTPRYSSNNQNDKIQVEIMEAVSRLEEFSFLTLRKPEGGQGSVSHAYDMHKLVQEAVSYRLHIRNDSISEAAPAMIAYQVIDMLFPTKWQQETWDECERYLRHAQQTGIWAQACGNEIDVLQLLSRVSSFLYNRGKWRDRELVNTLMLHLRERKFGSRHPDTISSKADLTTTYNKQGRYKEAENIALEVLKLRQDVLREDHPDMMCSMADVAETYYGQGRYDEAERIYMKVLELRRGVLRDKHPDTIRSMSDLAMTYRAQGRYGEGERIVSEVLELRRDVLGDEHPDTIRSMADLASIYHAQGRHNEGEKLTLEVLELRRSILGDKHPDTIHSMADLASTYYVQGRYDEDEKLTLEVLELRRGILGNLHPDTIRSMANLTSTYHAQGRYDEDNRLTLEVLELRRGILGNMHPDTIRSMADLTSTYYTQGKYDEDEKLTLEVLELRRNILGDKHPETIDSMAGLASTYHAQGRYNESEKLKLEVLELRRNILGEKHPDTIHSMADLTSAYHAQRRHSEEESLTLEVLELRSSILGEKHPDTIDSMANLASTYHAQRRYNEAEKLTLEVLELRRNKLGDKHPETIDSMANLASTYHAQGRYNEAEKLTLEVLELRRNILGDKHPDTLHSMANLASAYHAQGRYDEDEKLSLEVLELRRSILGDKHPDTIRSMTQLTSIYYTQGKYDEDEKLTLEVLELRRSILGDKHLDTIQSMASLASTYHAQGRYDEDERLTLEVLELQRDILGDEHSDTIGSMVTLASTYHAQGRYNLAEKIRFQVFELQRNALGDNHPKTIQIKLDLENYHVQGRKHEAENISIGILDPQRDALGDQDLDMHQIMARLGVSQASQKAYHDTGHLGTQDVARVTVKTKKTKLRRWRWWRGLKSSSSEL